jgi:two-component system nitrate/nitrite response regulator NarL
MTRRNLTPREQEVLGMVAAGQSNKEVAFSLGITRSTVDLHVHHILQALGVTNRVAATLWALRHDGGGGYEPEEEIKNT